MTNIAKSKKKVCYCLDKAGRFVIENYTQAKLFTNFFPGIAGMWGIPMWVFYVNRGQAISSFGIESKDKSIMEFQPANKAYRLTSLYGFRTFLKVRNSRQSIFYEPFQNNLSNHSFKISQRMVIDSHDLTIAEINSSLGISVSVNYFTLPQEPYVALVRRVTIKNLSKKNLSLEALDGMPVLVPCGLSEWALKNMSRTAEAWCQVTNLEAKAPYFNLRVAIADTPQVTPIKEGNFYASFMQEGRSKKLLDPIVRTSAIFGLSNDLVFPEVFLNMDRFRAPKIQMTDKKMPCAMSFTDFSLKAGEEKEIISLIGHIDSVAKLNGIVKNLSKEFIDKKAQQNKTIMASLKNYIFTSSSSKEFDLYCGQTFIDNVLRGGFPVSLPAGERKVNLNIFSRKHGDPERDYNYFVLSPTFLSQGNGNYRDINQNRRNDPWFNPEIKENHIIQLLSLIQADGYNPLIIKGTTFSIENPKKLEGILKNHIEKKGRPLVRAILQKDFLPGELLTTMVQNDIKLSNSQSNFLADLLIHCEKKENATHGEGYWSDHWTYNLDLIESYLSLYPEKFSELFLEKKVFSFHHSAFYVLPREQRYCLTSRGCRQYHGVFDGKDEIKVHPDQKLRSHNGKGEVYLTSLIVKLLCLIANKASSFDPSGIGIEMEADKPSWYDALNGLPGLFGSSTSETFELKRFCLFLLEAFENISLRDEYKINIFEELASFIVGLSDCLTLETSAFSYWNQSQTIKENYRRRLRQGLDGWEKEVPASALKKFLKLVIAKCDKAIKFAKDKKGYLVTYLTHEVKNYQELQKTNQDNFKFIRPTSFKRHDLPLFLEGFVHALRVEKNKEAARKIYQTVRKSPLFDRKLKMYKVNADLSGETEEIGRARIFPKGWLENESIWLHMEYKFLLELLRAGLYEEFYENFKNAGVPFLNPEIYGRSILENSSFLVSSAHEDSELHGRGFVARLSGTTAELLHMWLLMNAGERPFRFNGQGCLTLQFNPKLPGWLFTKEEARFEYADKNSNTKKLVLPINTYAFNFLGSTLVVYHNPKRKNTFGKNKAEIEKITLTYPNKSQIVFSSVIIPFETACEIRNGKVERIDIRLK